MIFLPFYQATQIIVIPWQHQIFLFFSKPCHVGTNITETYQVIKCDNGFTCVSLPPESNFLKKAKLRYIFSEIFRFIGYHISGNTFQETYLEKNAYTLDLLKTDCFHKCKSYNFKTASVEFSFFFLKNIKRKYAILTMNYKSRLKQ